MSLDYTSYIATIANECVQDTSNADFIQIMPQTISYAENRLYNELNLLATIVRDSSASTTANSRNFTLPQTLGVFQAVDRINVLTPAGSTVGSGTRSPVIPCNPAVLDVSWPSETAPDATSYPNMFAMDTDQTIILGPPPGAAFVLEVCGWINPTPLSSTNPTTYLTTYFPSIFIAASMVFMSGWMRNYGSQADDPQQAMSWETQYQKLYASADMVDARQKFAAAGWTSNQPEPIAATPR